MCGLYQIWSEVQFKKTREVNEKIKVGTKLRHKRDYVHKVGYMLDFWEVVSDETSHVGFQWRSLFGSKAFYIRPVHSEALGDFKEADLREAQIVHTYDIALGSEWEIVEDE